MADAGSEWWFSADRQWHRGRPPAGWWQAADRRWHPPEDRIDGGGGAEITLSSPVPTGTPPLDLRRLRQRQLTDPPPAHRRPRGHWRLWPGTTAPATAD